MAFTRYISPALAVAACIKVAHGQESCPRDETVTVTATGTIAQFSGCPTYTGTIIIAPSESPASVEISGLQGIQGDLVVPETGDLQSLSLPNVRAIGGAFNINGATALQVLNCPQLNNVERIEWTALPQLQSLSFSDTGVQYVESCSIVNTQLNTLDGLNFRSLDSFTATNNPFLQEITMQLGNITNSFVIADNGNQMKVELPNLVWASNLTLGGVNTLNIPSLEVVNNSLSFTRGSLGSIDAFNLTKIGADLAIYANNNLTIVNMPGLQTIGGGLLVANNTIFSNISFPALETVAGAVDIDGAYDTLDMPKIRDVRGAFTLVSSEDIQSICDGFQDQSGPTNDIKGTFDCRSADADASTNNGGTGTSSGSSETSKGAANGMFVPTAATGLMGVVVAIFGLL